jgi:predicted phosphoadenosine phosphosulfate sulfurtransferase
MPKLYLGVNVLEAAQERIAWTFDTFERVYLSFSSGKDSTAMLHLVATEARKRGVKFGCLFIDWECQFTMTIDHARHMFSEHADCIEPYWVQLPLTTVNGCSQFEPEWCAWDDKREKDWVRQKEPGAIHDGAYFDFYKPRMTFEEFVPLFAQWYGQEKKTACFVGIRTQESLNRFRSIARRDKPLEGGKAYTTNVCDDVWNVYPIYDWQTEDIWVYHARTGKPYNRLYDRMHQAGMTIHQMRICEPFGETPKHGLWLYQVVEPTMWAKMVYRVAGAATGALYGNESGNVMGHKAIALPSGYTWEGYANFLLGSMPPKTAEHYRSKIAVYLKWWRDRGYPEGIPQEADRQLETHDKVPSWRKICKSLLNNDYWCRWLGFSPTKTTAYSKYMDLMRKRRKAWGIFDAELAR